MLCGFVFYKQYNDSEWNEYTNQDIILQKNQWVKFGGKDRSVSMIKFKISGLVKASGSIQSLVNDYATWDDKTNDWKRDENGNIIHSNLAAPHAIKFEGCSGLITAPELPATELFDGCYTAMFNGCTSLNYIKVGFTDWNNRI